MAIRFDRIELSDDGNHLYPYIEGTDGYLATQTQHGLLRIGAGNASFSHFFTDRPSFYFNVSVSFDGSVSAYGGDENLTNWNNVDAAKFRDKDSTTYYLDPSNTSIALKINGIIDQDFSVSDLNAAWTAPGDSYSQGFIVGRFQASASNAPGTNNNANWFANIYSHSKSGSGSSYGIQLAGSDASGGENALQLRTSSNGAFSSWRKVYHEGHKPTYSELGTMAYSNLTGTPTIPSTSSFVDLTSTQTISGAKTFTGSIDLSSGGSSIKKTAGGGSGNHAAIELYADGTSDAGAAIAIQQQTSEGDTIIFADYEPHVEWGISAENNSNEIHFTAGNTTGQIGSKTFRNNSGTARTAYKKININLGTGMLDAGGDLRSPIYYDRTNTAFKIDAPGGSVLGQTTFRQGASDQNNTTDTGSIPSTTGAEMIRFEGNYTNGQYTHELAKIDRGGNLPLYLRQSGSTANSFTNLVRFGGHSNSQKEFEVFGDAQAHSYFTTGNSTASAFYDSDNSGRYVDPGSSGDSTFLRGYIRSSKYKRFASVFDSELPSAMPMIGGDDSSIGRGYGTVGFDTNGRLAIYERVYTIKISGSGWLNRHSNPIPIFPPSGNHFLVVEDFVIYIDYAIRTGISNSGIAGSGQSNAYSIGFYENAQGSGSTASPGSGQFFTLGVMPKNFVQNATTDQGYYRDVPVHQSKLLPNRGLFLRTGRDCTSTSNAPGGIHYVQIKYRIINTSSEMESEVDYDVNYAGTTTNRTTPLHLADGSFISY